MFCFVLFCFVLFCFVLFCFILFSFSLPSLPPFTNINPPPPPRITITNIYYLIRSDSQTIDFWGDIEGVSGSATSFKLDNFDVVDDSGNVESLTNDFDLEQETGNCIALDGIVCEHGPGGVIGSVRVTADPNPTQHDPRISVRFILGNWDNNNLRLKSNYNMDGCLNSLSLNSEMDVSDLQECSSARAAVNFDNLLNDPGTDEITFAQGATPQDLEVTVENTNGGSFLTYAFSFKMNVPGYLDGNIADPSEYIAEIFLEIDPREEGSEPDEDDGGDGDGGGDDSGASLLNSGFSVVFCLFVFLFVF